MIHLAVALAALPFLAEPEQAEWPATFCAVLTGLASPESNKAAEHPYTLELQAGFLDPHTSAPALFSMWVRDVPIEVFWWRKDERVARALIVALYLSRRPALSPGQPEVAGVPSFATFAERFEPREALHRREELQFVMAHRSSIAGLFARAYKAHRIPHRGIESYERIAESGDGAPLPCVGG